MRVSVRCQPSGDQIPYLSLGLIKKIKCTELKHVGEIMVGKESEKKSNINRT